MSKRNLSKVANTIIDLLKTDYPHKEVLEKHLSQFRAKSFHCAPESLAYWVRFDEFVNALELDELLSERVLFILNDEHNPNYMMYSVAK